MAVRSKAIEYCIASCLRGEVLKGLGLCEAGFFASVVSWQFQLSGGFHASGLLALSLADEVVFFRLGERAVLLAIGLGGFRSGAAWVDSKSNDPWGCLPLADSSLATGDKGLPGLLTDVNHLSIKREADTSVFGAMGDEGDEGAEYEGAE